AFSRRFERSYFFFVAVEVVVFDSVVVVVPPEGTGVAISVEVVVVVVPVAVVPVSSTTVGCSVVVVVSVVVSSFFLQPVTSAVANTATRPKVTSFFISLISFSLSALFTQKESPQNCGGMIPQPPPLSTGKRPRPGGRQAYILAIPAPTRRGSKGEAIECSRVFPSGSRACSKTSAGRGISPNSTSRPRSSK